MGPPCKGLPEGAHYVRNRFMEVVGFRIDTSVWGLEFGI